jgi:DNA-binding protein H-NS
MRVPDWVLSTTSLINAKMADYLLNIRIIRTRGVRMKRKLNLEAMSLDEMWQLHEEINHLLSIRLASEKHQLESRLNQLRNAKETLQPEQPEPPPSMVTVHLPRRKYPRVAPKYRNPNEPCETWSGRGKQPRWLVAAVNAGHAIEEFLIGNAASNEAGEPARAAE